MISFFDKLEGATILSLILFEDGDVVGTEVDTEEGRKSILITTDIGVFNIFWSNTTSPTMKKEIVGSV
jgi:hypothetical protein